MGKGGEKEQEEKKELLEKEFRSLLRPPPLAIPTAALGVSVLLLHSFLSYLYVVGVLPAFVVLPVLYLTSFAAFTVVHDAVHHSISPNHFVNDAFGWACALLLGPTVTFLPFRFVHLQHHKYTNVEEKDPDLFSTTGPGYLLPLRWSLQDFHYHTVVLNPKKNEMCRSDLMITVLVLIVQLYACYLGFQRGYGQELLVCYIIPARMAIFTLAATFDYLPHTPKVVPITESRYHTTSLMVCHKILKPFFSAVLLYQNFHIMHHLYPTIPFYLYERAYLCKKDELDEKEIPVRRLPFHSYEEKAF